MEMDPSAMAEYFADRAYGRRNRMTNPTGIQSQRRRQQSPQEIRPLGWGPIAERIVAESVPVFEKTERFVPPMRSPSEIDADLLSSIRRGREAGLRAVGFDEIGDVITAKQLYMESLRLLVPACRELDNGPETNRITRLREKAKVRREASTMLGRCEELNRMMESSHSMGRSVRQDMPNARSSAPSITDPNRRSVRPTSTANNNNDSSRPAPNGHSFPSRPAIATEPEYFVFSYDERTKQFRWH